MSTNKTIVFLSHFDGNLYLFRLPIMEALAQKGWRVIALCPSGEYSDRFAAHNITHINYRVDRAGLNPLSELKTLCQIRTILKQLQPDILHAFTAKPNLYGAIAGRLAGVKRIFISVTGLGSFFLESDLKSRLVRMLILALYRLAARLSVAVVFQNRDDRALFIQKRIVREKQAILIPGSGIDTTHYKPLDRASNEKPVVLFVGRLIAHKGIYEFLEAARAIGERARFIVVGSIDAGNPWSLSQEAIDRFSQERVAEFVGWCDPKPYFKQADIFVLPSYREGLPRTAIEAAAMGLAIVTTDSVGCRESVIDQKTGILVKPQDTHALKKAIEKLIDQPEKRAAMGEAGRKLAIERFDIRQIVTAYLALYDPQA
jgi:N,N'-diacetylbacillosaminyl-diphospho-undecaprenol alpha-1,3-N-acetylgalactosaminyltransferase